MERARRRPEQGYILIALLFMVAVILIVMATAAPAIGTQIKREREEEMIHRAKQYQRAIQLYYRKFGRFPASLDELQNTNNIRFLRKKYKDPITNSDEWRLIRFGQAKPKAPPAYLGGGAAGSAQQGMMIGQSAQSISRPLSGNRQTMGGGPIVGVASTSEKESLKEIDGKNHYNDWEFVYDPSLDPMGRQQQPGAPGGGQRPPQPGPGPQVNPGPQPPPGPTGPR